MGQPMAERLIDAGFQTVGYDVRPLIEFGPLARHMTTDATDLATCDVVISVVRDVAQTYELLQAMGDLPPVFVLSSTLSPRFVRRLRDELPDSVTLIDAPMSGAPHSARDGSLSFMLGGPDAAIDRLMPAFGAMGGTIHRLGGLGNGATAKVLNNFVAASAVASVRTALAQALELGLSPDDLLHVMDTSSGQTWYGTNIHRIDWANQTYDRANTIGILEKDVTAYLDAVSDGGQADDFTTALLQRLRDLPKMPV